MHIHKAERYLKDHYTRTRFTIASRSEEWPPNKPKCFSNVTLIHHKDKVKSKNEISAIATVKTTGSFNINTLSKKSSLTRSSSLRENMKHHSLEVAEEYLKQNILFKDVAHIFELAESISCNILIDGAPGIGKTYLCKEIAYQWSQGELLNDKKLLFLVFLREQRVHSLNTVKDLVRHSCQLEDDEAIGLIATYLHDTEGETLTLLLDGYDEISNNLSEDHLISRIINHSILSKAVVVITSRSIACGSLYDYADHRIEILGFTMKDRQKFISEALKDSPSEITRLKQYLGDHPAVCSLCYIPLYMTIFLYLLKQNDLPHSRTEFYKKFVELTIRYYMKKNEQSYKDLQTIILSLARFSYDMLQKDQVIFSLAEVSKASPNIDFQIPGAIHGFGILQVTEHFSTTGPEKTYTLNFVHSSMQEYLAALYIESLPDNKQIELLKHTFWNEKYLNTWIMYVGLTKGKTAAFKSFLADKQFTLARRNSELVQISSKIVTDKLKRLYLLQCFMEAKNEEMCNKMGESLQNKQIDLSGETLLPNHMITLAFFLTHNRPYSVGWDKLDLSNCNMQDIGCFMLLRELNSCEARTRIRVIDLSYNQLTVSSVGMLAELVQKCETEELDITGNQLEDKGAEYFSYCLKGNEKLKVLKMNNNNVTCNLADKIESEMRNTTSLQIIGITSCQLYVRKESGSHIIEVLQHYFNLTKFTMSYCLIAVEEMIAILKLLARNKNLNTLQLLHNNLGRMDVSVNAYTVELSALRCLSSFTLLEPEMLNIAADELISAIKLNGDLKMIALSNPKLQAVKTSYLDIAHILQLNPFIVFLEIPECFPENEQSLDCLVAAIKTSSLLQKIDISKTKLSTHAIKQLANALENVVNLKSLIMKSNRIDENAAKALACSLKGKRGLEVLDLGMNRIGSTGAVEISQALKSNTVLRVLNLHNNNIESSAAREISSMITNKINLLEVDISQNSLKTEGIIKIANALQHVSSLKTLDLSSNKITPEAATHIGLALRNNSLLESLDVSHNSLQSSGCINLCKELRNNHHLKSLNISHNKIKSEAASEIGRALKDKRALEVLNISVNNFGTKISMIIASLKSCKRLRNLTLNDSGIVNLAVEKLYQIIHANPLLELLNVSLTKLQTAGAVTLFKALNNKSTLQILDVSHNEIDDTAVEQLVCSLQNSTMLRELKIQCNPLSSKASEYILSKMCENIKSLRNIRVPHISDGETKTIIVNRIERINVGREPDDQLKWFSDC